MDVTRRTPHEARRTSHAALRPEAASADVARGLEVSVRIWVSRVRAPLRKPSIPQLDLFRLQGRRTVRRVLQQLCRGPRSVLDRKETKKSNASSFAVCSLHLCLDKNSEVAGDTLANMRTCENKAKRKSKLFFSNSGSAYHPLPV